jgi:hypothetical protein
MAGVKARGIITHHLARHHDEREIKPCRWIADGKGKGIMVAQYKDTGDLVLDQNGNPIPWGNA